MRKFDIVQPFPVIHSVSLSVETGLMRAEMRGDVPRLSEICGHGEILLENEKMVFSIIGGDPVLSACDRVAGPSPLSIVIEASGD